MRISESGMWGNEKLLKETRMSQKKKRHLLWIIPMVLLFMLLLPLTVGAVAQPEALAGLQAVFDFFIKLAGKAIEAYQVYLSAL